MLRLLIDHHSNLVLSSPSDKIFNKNLWWWLCVWREVAKSFLVILCYIIRQRGEGFTLTVIRADYGYDTDSSRQHATDSM